MFDKNITSGNELHGFQIIENLGIVRGIVVRSRSIVGSIWGSLHTLIGGDITAFSELCEQARMDAYNKMINEARRLGADGIIGFRYEANEIMQGVTEVLAYGTAVKAKKIPPNESLHRTEN